MKKYLLASILLLFIGAAIAQPAKKPAPKTKHPAQSEMDKAMDDATKGMSAEEKAEMRKMMNTCNADNGEETRFRCCSFYRIIKNGSCQKDINRINSIPKNIITEADVST